MQQIYLVLGKDMYLNKSNHFWYDGIWWMGIWFYWNSRYSHIARPTKLTSDYAGYLNDLRSFNLTSTQWTWLSGSTTSNQRGTYGTGGTPSRENIVGARCEHPLAISPFTGNLLIFGGYAIDSAGNAGIVPFVTSCKKQTVSFVWWLNDLWTLGAEDTAASTTKSLEVALSTMTTSPVTTLEASLSTFLFDNAIVSQHTAALTTMSSEVAFSRITTSPTILANPTNLEAGPSISLFGDIVALSKLTVTSLDDHPIIHTNSKFDSWHLHWLLHLRRCLMCGFLSIVCWLQFDRFSISMCGGWCFV